MLLTYVLILANRSNVLGHGQDGPIFKVVATVCVAVSDSSRSLSCSKPSSASADNLGMSAAHAPVHLTVAERHELGRSARTRLPRSSLADYVAAHDRPDPVALLETQVTTRVAELAPIRHGRMLASPFSFYRGAAMIMASDLAAGPHTGQQVQVRRRAPVQLRALRLPGAQSGLHVNDFDETLPGP